MAQGIGGAAAIRELLDDLHAELSAYPPELDEPKSLEDIMWNLERLGLRNSSASARGAAAAALGATSLDQLEVLLEVDADWHPADGMWSLAADVPSDLSTLTAANAQGRRVLVPRETWPSYECLEHNGTGWEALIEKVARGNARVRFLYATTARGVRYAESDLELSVLRPL